MKAIYFISNKSHKNFENTITNFPKYSNEFNVFVIKFILL